MKNSTAKALIFILLFSIGTSLFSQENEINKSSDITKTDFISQHPLLSNRFTFYVGLYNSTKEVKVGVNGASDNELINFSEKADFNDNETTLFLNFNWRFARMWSLTAEYFSVKNGLSRTIDEEFKWNDQIYKGGAGVSLGLNVNLFRVLIGRTITKGLKHELGAGLGAHVLDVKTFIEGYAYINNDDTGEGAATSFERSSVNVVAPLPNIGAWYFYAPHPKWMLTARVDWFALSVGEYSGGLWDLGAGVNYQFHKNIGVGLNYRYFDFTAKVDKTNWDGEFSLIFQGPLLTVNANF
tara:strand:- start:1045 stop:1935 length:891 start_codon:yes stop_codon:yes gene_type:complete